MKDEDLKKIIDSSLYCQCPNYLATFLKYLLKTKVIVFVLIVTLFIGPFFTKLLLSFLSKTTNWWLFFYLTSWSISLVILYFYFSRNNSQFSIYINKHQTFISMLAISIPILILFLQQSSNDLTAITQYRFSLQTDNYLNSSHLQSIYTDLPNDPNVVFWRNFYTDNYRQYWSMMRAGFSNSCSSLYAELAIDLEALNNMNQKRIDLIPLIAFNNDMVNYASSSMHIIEKILKECQ